MNKPPPMPESQEDARPFWKRLLASLRPKVSVEHEGKTGKRFETVQITGRADF